MSIITQEIRDNITPDQALEKLLEGNQRFLNQNKVVRDELADATATAPGQFPYAVIVSCIDSRTSSEIIFDQGIGDIFNIRIAGNIINEDILGSLEFACKLAGCKLILVLGHTKCGAVKGACDDAELGNLTALLSKIKPAINNETSTTENRSSSNDDYVENVAALNVTHSLSRIRTESPILVEMESSGLLKIAGGTHDIETGKVEITD